MNSLPCHYCEDLFATLHSRSLKLNIHRILQPHQRYVISYFTRNVITILNAKYFMLIFEKYSVAKMLFSAEVININLFQMDR